MTREELSNLTDEELATHLRKMKSTITINALIIGFMIGIIIFSIWKNSIGFFTLIPLFFAYKIINGSNHFEDLKEVVKERGLKN